MSEAFATLHHTGIGTIWLVWGDEGAVARLDVLDEERGVQDTEGEEGPEVL